MLFEQHFEKQNNDGKHSFAYYEKHIETHKMKLISFLIYLGCAYLFGRLLQHPDFQNFTFSSTVANLSCHINFLAKLIRNITTILNF